MTRKRGYRVLIIIYALVIVAGSFVFWYANDTINQAVENDRGANR